jgi:nitrogen fixation NifU-like protein
VPQLKYSDKTLAYYEKMKNIGTFDDSLPNVGTGIVGSPLCGDVMKLQLFFDDNDIVADAKYKVFGCVSAIASMELTTTILKGMTIGEALEVKNENIANTLELTTIKRHCSVLAKEAIEAAVNNYLAKKNKENNMIIVTDNATKELKKLLGEHKSIGIAISVNQKDCSGFDYSLSYKSTEPDGMAKLETNGILFFYDPNIEMLINGLQIDVVKNDFGCGFIVTNKNHASACPNCTCGCR